MHLPTFLIFLLAVPLVELFLLIEVGRSVGALTTIGLALATAALGIWLLRQQGAATIRRARKTMAAKQVPALEIIEGLILIVAGLLLLVPGFLTDFFGFSFLLPCIRQNAAKKIGLVLIGRSGNESHSEMDTSKILETEYTIVEKTEKRYSD